MELAIIGLIGVVVGAVVTAFLTWIREWWFQSRTTRKETEYLAIQVSCALERYVAGCSAVASDEGECGEHGDNEPIYKLPSFETDSLDVEWKALPGRLMYEVLDFPYRAELADRRVFQASINAIPPGYDDWFEERQYQYAVLGVAASELVEKLRKHAGLMSRPSDGKWDPVTFMKEKITTIERRRETQAELHRIAYENYCAESAT
jgi:hypothetical protein